MMLLLFSITLIFLSLIVCAILVHRIMSSTSEGSQYTVYYKHPSWIFYRRLTGINGDGVFFARDEGIPGRPATFLPLRYFTRKDGSRIEMPMDLIFFYGRDRFEFVEARMKTESGGTFRGV